VGYETIMVKGMIEVAKKDLTWLHITPKWHLSFAGAFGAILEWVNWQFHI